RRMGAGRLLLACGHCEAPERGSLVSHTAWTVTRADGILGGGERQARPTRTRPRFCGPIPWDNPAAGSVRFLPLVGGVRLATIARLGRSRPSPLVYGDPDCQARQSAWPRHGSP